MNKPGNPYLYPLIAWLFIAVFGLVGCSSDNDDEEAQAQGIVFEGPAGTAIAIPEDPDDIVAVNAVLDLSNTVSVSSAGKVAVHFFLKDDEGNGISLTENACSMRIYSSMLVESTAADDPGLNWHQILGERANSITDEDVVGLLTVHDGETGEYTYQLADEEGALAAALAAASPDDVFRLTLRTRCRSNINGSNYYVVNPVNASYDFAAGDPATRLADSGADMAATEACLSCHGDGIGGVGHGGGYTEVKSCNNCHNLDYQENDEADLAFMIHRIHDAGMFEALDHGDPADFSHVTYPQQTYTCTKCHSDDAPNADVALMNPTRRNCGSCHEDVVFSGAGQNHPGDTQLDDTLCTACHVPGGTTVGGLDIPGTEHDFGPFNPLHGGIGDPNNQPEFNVTISMEDPDNGEYYVAGETPLITVTLAPRDGGAAVDYTATQDGAGDRDGDLRTANLYVYGPRSQAVPVLTTDSTTDGGNSQGHSLFTGGADAQVVSDAAGFKYELLDQIDQLEPGTYMVRFEGGDYGAVSGTDYVTTSTAVINFQVGTATEEPKVAGDACTNCHGDTRMHLTGSYAHNQAFDTDGCLGCHDTSEVNYGNYIGNRVHAVHSGSETGDLGPHAGYDWSHVAFPQDINNCTICHTNEVDTPVWRTTSPVACAGCHGADPNADNLDEAVAASHMISMGAVTQGDGRISESASPIPGCLVCHGEGQDFDLYVEHNLVDYGVPSSSND